MPLRTHLRFGLLAAPLLLEAGCGCPCPGPEPASVTQVVPVRPSAVSSQEPARPALPAGCSRISDGTGAILSPDGRLLVFARWRTITGEPIRSADKEYFYDRGAEPLIPRLWVRDLEAKSEHPLPKWTPIGLGEETPEWHGLPTSWTPEGALLLSDGAILDPRSGATVDSVLSPILSKKSGREAEGWTWSSDGRRLAYFDGVPPETPGETGRRAPFVMRSGEKGQRIDLTRPHDGKAPAWSSPGDYIFGGRLSLSPDGETLLMRLDFNRVSDRGVDLMEGIALYHAGDGGVVLLGEFPNLDRAPSDRAGKQVWDAAGRRCVFVGAITTRPAGTAVYEVVGGESRRVSTTTSWEGTMDVYVVDGGGHNVQRVTQDGREKRQACLDPAGGRVAFFVRDHAIMGSDATESRWRLRVAFLDRGRAWESRLAPPPDEWAPLGTLGWSAGGKSLVYTYEGVEGAVYSQEVPADSQ